MMYATGYIFSLLFIQLVLYASHPVETELYSGRDLSTYVAGPLEDVCETMCTTVLVYLVYSKQLTTRRLKVHKIEIFFGFDFEICIISLLVMSKY